MKTPVSYYGGKQNLVKEILSLFPKHDQYVEPFFGGGAVFFAKQQIKNEVINDLDERVINFYRCLKDEKKFLKLQRMVKLTLHSESEYYRARDILKSGLKNDIEFAWAFWVQTNMSFSKKIFGGFAFSNDSIVVNSTKQKRDNFNNPYFKRMANCEIFCRDAIKLILLKDTPDTFFYCDPPYVSSEQGHYKGYTLDDFTLLLDTLKNIKGKFLLSSYPEKILIEYREKYNWNFKDINGMVSVGSKKKQPKYKTECLTYNYQLDQLKLFK